MSPIMNSRTAAVERGLALVLSDRDYNVSLLARVILGMGVVSLERPARPLATEMIREARPDVVFYVANPERAADVELAASIATVHRGEMIAVVPGADDSEDVRMLSAGADACIHDSDRPELAEAVIRALMRRGHTGSESGAEEVLEAGDISLYPGRYEVRVAGRPVRLTVTEFQVLSVLMRSPNVVYTPLRLLEQATGAAYAAPEARDAVKVFIRRIRVRLDEQGISPAAIVNVRGVGYMLQPELARISEPALTH